MHPITEISTSSYFEPSSTSKPQELSGEDSPFLKLLEEFQSSDSEKKVNSTEVDSEANEEISTEVQEEAQIEDETVYFLLPQNWEISSETQEEYEEVLETDLAVEEEVEELELTQDAPKEIQDPPKSKELKTQIENEVVNVSNQELKEEVPFKESASLEPSLESALLFTQKEDTFKNVEVSNLSNPQFTENFQEVTNEKTNPQTLEQVISSIKEKVDGPKQIILEISSSNEVQELPSLKESISSDILNLFKEKISSSKEQNQEEKTNLTELKPPLSQNEKLIVREEKSLETQEVKFTSPNEKENINFALNVQTQKLTSHKDANKPSVVHESFKPTPELWQKNNSEFVKSAKLQILENGKNFALIELEPKELGKVLLQIYMEKDKIQGKLIFETEAAKYLFQSELQNLKNELRIAGLEIESFIIDLSNSEQNSKEFFSFESSEFLKDTSKESSNLQEDISQEEVSQTTKRLLDVRV